jgi:hypothetical protein
VSDSQAPEHTPEPAPIRYADDEPWQELHPDLAERMLRQLYAQARPLFAYFHREAMMGGVQERKPSRREAHGAPDTQRQ